MRPPQPFESCPRWHHCSVNNCPLSPEYPDGYTHPEDPEKKCTLPKSYRRKVAEKSPGILRFEGLTPKEFTGMKAWLNRPSNEREETITMLKKNGFGTAPQKEHKELGVIDGGVINARH